MARGGGLIVRWQRHKGYKALKLNKQEKMNAGGVVVER